MKKKKLATLICRQNHPAEWEARTPRVNPCVQCTLVAHVIFKDGWRKP